MSNSVLSLKELLFYKEQKNFEPPASVFGHCGAGKTNIKQQSDIYAFFIFAPYTNEHIQPLISIINFCLYFPLQDSYSQNLD